ncbi:hypothetical protein IX317_000409 [Fusobacterium sp. DD29]|uniref:DUF896 domain-containing protein n=1 Tax=unclassified Fusobacterium TaxID=2648384 RepID=UPI001B8D2998|nr:MULTISPECIES: DUF896 domain-containing protein [unclassified Fusobacterium]MBR8700443.1 hypothetical protein [Fusobacterium sp. DD45]MBR8710192.1 hypothetical protein [Fusobacterium sp. DD28]MBR8748749.1 hypothetical protein [Fusobacterium sp. DD29]MBR8750707.1 hypothetical protein [Fusobacterium sp. DD26]MBR8761016.1 hypothetical protein [Fusobacterium sp. DD25]
MEMKDIIAKVNYFSKLARERELTKEEQEEREKYRKMYLEKFKAQVKGHLDSIKIVDNIDDGKDDNKLI